MKHLVQKIRKKDRPQSESEYVQRLKEEDTGLEEVRIAGVPSQSEVQQDPTILATLPLSVGSNLINTAKGPVLMAVKKKIGQNIPGNEMGNIAKGMEQSVHALVKRFKKEKEFATALGEAKNMEERTKFSSGLRKLLLKKIQERQK